MKKTLLAAVAVLSLIPSAFAAGENYQGMVASHAAANGVPVELVHRVIMRESRYNPRAVSKGNYGMMQIRLQTARGMGYTGTAEGLLDPNTNLTYAVKYLAGAYRVAGGNMNRAVSNYAGGYYYAAKRQGMLPQQQVAEVQPFGFGEQVGYTQPGFYDANARMYSRHKRYHRHHRHVRHHRRR